MKSNPNQSKKFKPKQTPSIQVGKRFKKDKKVKTKKERFDYKTAFREFPVKFVRDVVRIKWISKTRLGQRFIAVMLFIIFFALAYAGLDQLITYVFRAAHII